MDIVLFLLGATGALLTVYLAKQDAVPEFRLLFDTFETDKEVMYYQGRIKKMEKSLDEIQDELKDEMTSVKPDTVTRLTTVLETTQAELHDERPRLQTLEGELKWSQVFSRSLGFLVYIFLGGVFGALLAGRVKIEGMSGDLPSYFQSIVIGATWITYLSAIGLRTSQAKADNIMETGKKEATELFDKFKKIITLKVERMVAEGEEAGKVKNLVLASEVKSILEEELSKLNISAQNNWDRTRQMVGKHARGVL